MATLTGVTLLQLIRNLLLEVIKCKSIGVDHIYYGFGSISHIPDSQAYLGDVGCERSNINLQESD